MIARVGSFARRRMPWLASPILVAAAVLLAACDSPVSLSDPLLVTDGPSYVLRAEGLGWRVEIPYTFTNRTGGPVYLVNCNGAFAIRLDRLVHNAWKEAWSPILPLCLSAPIVIAEGATFRTTLHVWGARPNENAGPQFDASNPAGTYRIVWVGAVSRYQDELPFGPELPLEARVSNAFELVFE